MRVLTQATWRVNSADMPTSSITTAKLRALSPDARRRKLLAAYRRAGTLEKTAHELGIPLRTLTRMIERDKLEREIAAIRNAASP